MKISVKQGATSVTVNIFIADSSSTTGAGLTGLAFNTASLTAYYARPKIAAAAITLATLAAVTSAYSSGGFKEIDATNMPGWYRFDIPDACLANAERFVSIHFKGATNMAPLPLEIALESWDNQTAISPTGDTYTRAGAPAGASLAADIAAIKTDTGNLVTRITSTLFSGITQLSHWLGAIAGKQAANATAQTEIRASGAGSGTYDPTTDSNEALRDNLALASALATVQADTDDIQTRIPAALAADGTMKSNIFGFLGTAFTEGAVGRFATNFKTFFNVGSAAGTQDVIPTVTTTTNLTTYTGNTPQTGDAYSALTGAQAEPGQGAPAANASPLTKLAYLFKGWRNRKTQTATTFSLYNDDAATVDQKAITSDDGTTATVGEIASGP